MRTITLLAVTALALSSAALGCTVDMTTDEPLEEEDDVGTSEQALLSGEQVYEIANLYNTGVADGFARSFSSINSYQDMNNAFNQQHQFWPGGPVAGGALGAAITYDGLPLPSFWSTGVTAPPSNTSAFSVVVNNSNILDSILINRTPYAAYFSLGSLIASANAAAHYCVHAPGSARQPAWDLAMSLLRDATNLANALCRPSANVWKTAFNVQEMRNVLATAPPGPHYGNWPTWNTSDTDWHFYNLLTQIRQHLGSVISNPATLESGVHGQGCY